MKFSQIQQQDKRLFIETIEKRHNYLNDLDGNRFEKVLKYLMVTNSGGAVGILSFISANPASIKTGGPLPALVLFVSGIIMTGLLIASEFHLIQSIMKGWGEDSRKFFNDLLDWDTLLKNDDKRSQIPLWEYLLAYASFFCFIIGSGIGLAEFVKNALAST